jgi:predicted metal-dependent hydrolase
LRKKIANTINKVVEVGNHHLPLRIILELRNSVRVAIAKDNVILRIPISENSRMDVHVTYALEWLNRLNNDRPDIIAKFHIQKYTDIYTLKVLDKFEYHVTITEQERSNGLVELKNTNQLHVTIPSTIPEFEKRKYIRTLLSKMISNRYKKYITDKVHYWNTMHFQKPINRISLKYNTSNWGSCSVNHNINLSTRSLLLPEPMLDYIIVHELSHLVEMNHSPRFWSVVSNVLPDFQSRENWILQNSKHIDF